MKKKRITKKTAEAIFKKIAGTSKGMENLSDDVRDMWKIKMGMIAVYCSYEGIYSTFGIRRDGEHIKVYIEIEEAASQTLYLDPETLETDNMYTIDQALRQEKENIKEYLDEQGLVPVPTIEAAEAGIKALYL